MRFWGPKDIKHHIKNLLQSPTLSLKNKKALDLPAGNGVSTKILIEQGAQVTAGDLIPDFFRVPEVPCLPIDINKKTPFEDSSFDFLLCQEGIEHISDQIQAFQEFNRILKMGGTLIITTPNYSNLRSKISYLLNESELFGKIMPPNEIESIWFSPNNNHEMYYGHLNLIGIQRLRLFAKLAGFDLVKLHPNRVNYTSALLFIFLYPFIFWFSWASYRRMKKKKGKNTAQKVRETFLLAISPQVLLEGHLIVEFQKTASRFSPGETTLVKDKEVQDFIT